MLFSSSINPASVLAMKYIETERYRTVLITYFYRIIQSLNIILKPTNTLDVF